MIPPRRPIRTERLLLRPSSAADADRAFEIQSDLRVTRMLRMATFPPDGNAMREWFADHEREWLEGTAFRFAVEFDGRMIGLTDLDEVAGNEADIGYWLEEAAWGKGFAMEAARAVTGFAFNKLGLSALKSGHAADNPASGRILTKLGFLPLDTVDVFSKPRGGMIRQCRYRLSPPVG